MVCPVPLLRFGPLIGEFRVVYTSLRYLVYVCCCNKNPVKNVHSLAISGVKSGTDVPSSNCGQVCCIQVFSYALAKDMNPFLHP